MLKLTVIVILFISSVKSDGDDHDNGHSLFDKYDSDHNGVLGKSEFSTLFMGFDAWPEDHRVSEHEFVNGWTSRNSQLSEPGSVTLFFFRTDLDGDRVITQNDINTLFSMFDENGNTSVSRQEFCDAFSAMYYAIDKC
ncbi:uncharacterized protein LOC132551107 [Ylistrum balloti]|uniref:uncharacterized protein LOC132551107 n=1 Tax=Ylistrum balloti TaxID=509963 RepID=UPI002905E7CD|nr:uncharacterized protein LOC132551107 [Ylistrum balloti]